MNNKKTIVILDDHLMVAEVWADIINTNEQYTVVDIFTNTSEKTMETIKEKRPNIVVMDINILPISGIDATAVIRKISPATKIIGVSMHNQPSYAKRILKNGASGYVTKSSNKQEMFNAFSKALDGGTYICKEIQEIISNQLLIDEEIPNISVLSEREIEVLKLIKEGLSSKEMAAKLFLSYRTIEVHRSNILKKLKQKNTISLINFLETSSLAF